ncbi:uncharacterized protein LOC124921715 [Impatiens glandulifera]|uniref:uncharacterized protein LOC124921715 n=1 Tax=Impatiens glandulifera TaxID=253017 RepID=UPI001FB0CFAB|nr:uncharacterized protein LOC124921715 [Impatiens glandulifera]
MARNINSKNPKIKSEKKMEDLSSMVMALEQATLMAKQLPVTVDPSQIHQIYSSLHSANQQLSSFLSFHQSPLPPPTAVGEPMQVGDDDAENEQNSKATIDGVEEQMKECFIQNKRPKRTLSPSAAATAEHQRRKLYDHEFTKIGSSSSGFDPHRTRLRSLELIYQFHG